MLQYFKRKVRADSPEPLCEHLCRAIHETIRRLSVLEIPPYQLPEVRIAQEPTPGVSQRGGGLQHGIKSQGRPAASINSGECPAIFFPRSGNNPVPYTKVQNTEYSLVFPNHEVKSSFNNHLLIGADFDSEKGQLTDWLKEEVR